MNIVFKNMHKVSIPLILITSKTNYGSVYPRKKKLVPCRREVSQRTLTTKLTEYRMKVFSIQRIDLPAVGNGRGLIKHLDMEMKRERT